MEAPATPGVIQYDDFAKLDLRVGTVIEAVPHTNADKLLVLKVDLGKEQRQIVAGIRAYYAPETLVGRQVIVVANLAPRAMRGVESQGMVLAGANEDRTAVILLTLEKPLPAGSKVT